MVTKRKRGAQLGNLNALQHGFYSRRFREEEIADLESLSEGLQDEAAMLRVLIRRVFDALANLENGESLAELKVSSIHLPR